MIINRPMTPEERERHRQMGQDARRAGGNDSFTEWLVRGSRSALQRTAAVPKTKFAPGNLVSLVLNQMGIKRQACGRCAEMREKMNRGGWIWCLLHRKELIAWFAAEARREGLDCSEDGIWNLLKAGIQQVHRARREMRAGRQIVINCNTWGMGDAIVNAWIAQGSKDATKKLICYATGWRMELLEILGQPVTDSAEMLEQSIDPASANSIELNLERGEVPRVISRARALGIDAEPVRPGPLAIPFDDQKWADDQIRLGDILLFPQCEHASRQWPASYWIDLAWSLQSAGIKTITLLKNRDNRFSAGVPLSMNGRSIGQICALIQKSRLVIGNDSGPVHLAGTLDIPTLVLLGPTKPTVFAHMLSVRCLNITTQELRCVGCHFRGEYRAACDQSCRALMMLSPERVMHEALTSVSSSAAGSQSACRP